MNERTDPSGPRTSLDDGYIDSAGALDTSRRLAMALNLRY